MMSMTRYVYWLLYFVFGIAVSCLFYLFSVDFAVATFYILGAAFASILVALLGSLIADFSDIATTNSAEQSVGQLQQLG